MSPFQKRVDSVVSYEKMNEEHIRQDERAIGTKLVNGKSALPLYGIVYIFL